MLGESVLWIFPVEFVHDPVPGDLGQDTGGGDTEADPIPANKCRMLNRESLDRQSIHEGMVALMSVFMKPYQGARHGEMRCSQDIQVSDFL